MRPENKEILRRLEVRLVIVTGSSHAPFKALNARYKISYADNPEEGLLLAKLHKPHLIILFCQEEKGLRVQLKKHSRTKRIPVLRAMAREQLDAIQSCCSREWDDFILVPCEQSELLLRVRTMIANRIYFAEKYVNFLPETAIENCLEKFLQNIKGIIEEHLNDPLFGVAELAREACVSQPQLYRKLIALTGFSPNGYIRHIRLNHAAHLLSERAGNVAEIACRVGFSSQSYFAKCFKAMHHQNPKQVLGLL